ncbi:vegetative cell wall protein gp1-like [Triticum dicoccoides]|uniref:vegetative cell wall protein gp1-like n=1 Tax=Triticum dicoccoides TaxID=85692 RepID=UPI0018915428|nr:vegetative cell wall protein gp1-like [Triticum dicoccoides]
MRLSPHPRRQSSSSSGSTASQPPLHLAFPTGPIHPSHPNPHEDPSRHRPQPLLLATRAARAQQPLGHQTPLPPGSRPPPLLPCAFRHHEPPASSNARNHGARSHGRASRRPPPWLAAAPSPPFAPGQPGDGRTRPPASIPVSRSSRSSHASPILGPPCCLVTGALQEHQLAPPSSAMGFRRPDPTPWRPTPPPNLLPPPQVPRSTVRSPPPCCPRCHRAYASSASRTTAAPSPARTSRSVDRASASRSPGPARLPSPLCSWPSNRPKPPCRPPSSSEWAEAHGEASCAPSFFPLLGQPLIRPIYVFLQICDFPNYPGNCSFVV